MLSDTVSFLSCFLSVKFPTTLAKEKKKKSNLNLFIKLAENALGSLKYIRFS